MTAHAVTWRQLTQLRMDGRATRLPVGEWATRLEPAAFREIAAVDREARDPNAFGREAPLGREEGNRRRGGRLAKHCPDVALLHHFAGVHHVDAVAVVRHDAQVLRDDQETGAGLR